MAGRSLVASLAIIAFLAVAPGWATEPAPSDNLTVVGLARPPVSVGLEELARLPAQNLSISFLTEHGPHEASFDGPLLWAVLEKTSAIDPANHAIRCHSSS